MSRQYLCLTMHCCMKCRIFLTIFKSESRVYSAVYPAFGLFQFNLGYRIPFFNIVPEIAFRFVRHAIVYKHHFAVPAPLQEPVFSIGIRECRVQIRGTAFCPCSHLYFGLIVLTKFHPHSFPIRRPTMPHIFAFLVRHAIFAPAFIRIAHYVRIPAANPWQIAASRSHGAAVQRYAPFAARCSILPHYVKVPLHPKIQRAKPNYYRKAQRRYAGICAPRAAKL